MEIIGAESQFVRQEAERWLEKRVCSFADLSTAVQRRVIELQLRFLEVPYDFDLIEKLRVAPDQYVSPATAIEVHRTIAGVVEKREISTYDFDPSEVHIDVSGNGIIRVGTIELQWKRSQRGGVSRVSRPQMEVFDAEKVGTRVFLRFWRPGDRFQPIGMKNPVKLQDLFTNLKVPASERRRKVVATTKTGEIFWVQGLRIGEMFKLTSKTKERLTWLWKNR